MGIPSLRVLGHRHRLVTLIRCAAVCLFQAGEIGDQCGQSCRN